LNHHSKIDSTKVLKPQLRFPLFREFWNYKRFEELYKLQVTNSFSRENLNYKDGEVLNIHYGDIHTKFPSHIFVDKIKIPLINPEVDLSRIREECYCREGDLIIADASEDYGDLGKSIEIINLGNKRMLAGLHTYLARPITQLVSKGFISYLMMSWKVRKQIMVLSNGTKVYGLPRKSLLETLLVIPSSEEQKKIASFLASVDSKIEKLTRKKELLEEYKKGVMQKLFNQEIRFKDDNGNDYPNWEIRKLRDALTEHKLKSTQNEKVFSVSVHKGLINQIEHLGRSFSAANTDNYNLVRPNDIVYTKSPTGDFPYGIIKQSKVNKSVIVSPLYGVFTPETKYLGYLLNVYFESKINVHNYLHSIIQKGAKNTINIKNETFLSKSLYLPVDKKEQKKIGKLLKKIDEKIEVLSKKLDKTKEFKKGLLQQMFV
jgi:type I restriction enzyme, S subunit